MKVATLLTGLAAALAAGPASAAQRVASAVQAAATGGPLELTASGVGYAALIVFGVAYLLVMLEEFTHLRKSKPVILSAGIIWALIAIVYHGTPSSHLVSSVLRHDLLEYAELLLFLLVAMTYINSMDERRAFDALRSWLVRKGFSYRSLFWVTGILAFFISPVADNLTTALLMCAVVMAVGIDSPRFVAIACTNIVVAANAGGAFSPFGDITTLMVWQKGMVEFWTFFALFVPSMVNFVVPAVVMHFFIPNAHPVRLDEHTAMKRGALVVIALFFLTIATAVTFHNFLHLPPAFGMMTGLGYLQLFGYYLRRTHVPPQAPNDNETENEEMMGGVVPFDVFSHIARSEWDTLLFFYGIVLSVGGLGFLGYLGLASELLYTEWGATYANVTVGVLSAIVDNIPVMFAVLTMNPDMVLGQWLLVTLTAGVGGSLLSIGSAAGVAVMGQARGIYTFFGHLKWTPVIAVGYAASIAAHLWLNAWRLDFSVASTTPRAETVYYRRHALRFECTGCGACCYGADEYVFVTDEDIAGIRDHLGISSQWMRRRYLTRDADGATVLAAEPDGRCVFLDDDARCRIYPARPVQCRTYPFWPEIVATRSAWRREARRCEGIGRGAVVPLRDIERALAALRRANLAPDT